MNFVSKRKEEGEGWGNLHNEELDNLQSYLILILCKYLEACGGRSIKHVGRKQTHINS
jgi:hypothetical protein